MDQRAGRTLDVPKVLAGRLPGPARAGEVAVDQIGAASLHLRVGATLNLAAVPNGGRLGRPGAPARDRRLARLAERVVGVFVTRSSVLPLILASAALCGHRLGPRYLAFDGAFVKLVPGATAAAVSREAQALARHFPGTGGQIYIADEGAQAATIERAIHPEVVALAVFALVLACTALLIVGQATARRLCSGRVGQSSSGGPRHDPAPAHRGRGWRRPRWPGWPGRSWPSRWRWPSRR